MSEKRINVYDNSNLSIICSTFASTPQHHDMTALSLRARIALTFLSIPRGGQMHQINGHLECDATRSKCSAAFNVPVACITDRIQVQQPIDTVESACQLVDDHICSPQWISKHPKDCYDLGSVTIIKGMLSLIYLIFIDITFIHLQ